MMTLRIMTWQDRGAWHCILREYQPAVNGRTKRPFTKFVRFREVPGGPFPTRAAALAAAEATREELMPRKRNLCPVCLDSDCETKSEQCGQ